MTDFQNYHVFAAIHVRYLGPTNYKGARYKAMSQAGNITRSMDYGLNPSGNAAKVAHELANDLGWLDGGRELVGGCLPNGEYVFTITGAGE